MSYTIHLQSGSVTRDDDGVEVAPCQSVTDPNYVAYVSWVESGNTPRVVDYPTPVVPQEVTMRQAQQALLRAGMLDMVEQVVSQADRAIQIDWFKGQTIRRDWPALKVVQEMLTMTDHQIDGLFLLAETL
jgi:hypothetical protein